MLLRKLISFSVPSSSASSFFCGVEGIRPAPASPTLPIPRERPRLTVVGDSLGVDAMVGRAKEGELEDMRAALPVALEGVALGTEGLFLTGVEVALPATGLTGVAACSASAAAAAARDRGVPVVGTTAFFPAATVLPDALPTDALLARSKSSGPSEFRLLRWERVLVGETPRRRVAGTLVGELLGEGTRALAFASEAAVGCDAFELDRVPRVGDALGERAEEGRPGASLGVGAATSDGVGACSGTATAGEATEGGDGGTTGATVTLVADSDGLLGTTVAPGAGLNGLVSDTPLRSARRTSSAFSSTSPVATWRTCWCARAGGGRAEEPNAACGTRGSSVCEMREAKSWIKLEADLALRSSGRLRVSQARAGAHVHHAA